jgi:AcrR family transcriptional regulator
MPRRNTEQTRETILRNTLAMIEGAEGVDGVTMRRVASSAGVTAMAIYKHFRNRRVLRAGQCENTCPWNARHARLLELCVRSPAALQIYVLKPSRGRIRVSGGSQGRTFTNIQCPPSRRLPIDEPGCFRTRRRLGNGAKHLGTRSWPDSAIPERKDRGFPRRFSQALHALFGPVTRRSHDLRGKDTGPTGWLKPGARPAPRPFVNRSINDAGDPTRPL